VKLNLKNKKYSVIYADPPWFYSYDHHRGYPLLKTEQLAKLSVPSITAPDATLFLWATFPCLPDAFVVMKAWGFFYKTIGFVWIKTNKRQDLNHPNFFQTPLDVATNIGNYTVPNAEICLLGIKGKPVHEYGIESVVFAPRLWHSKKPDEIRNRIAKYCRGAPKIELFARDKLPGWDSWGNQTKSDVELRFKT